MLEGTGSAFGSPRVVLTLGPSAARQVSDSRNQEQCLKRASKMVNQRMPMEWKQLRLSGEGQTEIHHAYQQLNQNWKTGAPMQHVEWHFERAKQKLDKECGDSINAETIVDSPGLAGTEEALAGCRDSGQYVQLASNGRLVSKDALTQSGAISTPNPTRERASNSRRTPLQRELTDAAMSKTKSSVMEIKNSNHSIYLDQARHRKNGSPYSFQRINDSELSMNALQIQGTLVGTAADRVDLFASAQNGLGLDSTCQIDRQSLFEVKI